MDRVAFFVDGFNLYHALREDPKYAKYKWLNLQALAKCFVRKNQQITKVFYFSAYATWDPAKMARHQTFVRTLQWAGVDVVLGKFKFKERFCTNCRTRYHTYEEKETDVNIAIKLFQEAILDRRRASLLWQVSACSYFMTTHSDYLFHFAMGSESKSCGGRRVKQELVKVCLACHGAGKLSPVILNPDKPIDTSKAPLVSPDLIPDAIKEGDLAISSAVDRMRAEGLFDDMVRMIEDHLTPMGKTPFDHKVEITSRIHTGGEISAFAYLATIKLAPYVVAGGIAFSSLHELRESGRQAGEVLAKPKRKYYIPCIQCQSTGVEGETR